MLKAGAGHLLKSLEKVFNMVLRTGYYVILVNDIPKLFDSSCVTIMGSQGRRHTRNQQTASGNDIIRFNKSQLHKKV